MAVSKKKAVEVPSVPASPTGPTIAISTAIPDPPKKMSLEERLAAKAGKKEETKSSSSKDWQVKLTSERLQELALVLAAGTHGKKVIEGQVKTARTELEPELVRSIASEWLKQQRQAENPTVVAPGCHFKFVVAETSATILKARSRNADIAEVLSKHGIAPDVQTKIMNDFKTEKVLSVDTDSIKKDKPELYEKFIEMLVLANEEGLYNAAGEEILRISDEDMAALVSQDTKVTVSTGFLDRVPTYIAASGGGVDQMLSAMKAIEELGVINFRIPGVTVDSPEATIDRLIRGSSAPTTPVSQGFKTSDGRFHIEAKGSDVVCTSIPQMPDETPRIIFKKNCPGGSSHAVNLARKLAESPNRLAEEIAASKS